MSLSIFSRNPSSTLDAAIRKHSLNVCGGGGGESRHSPTHSPPINPDAAATPSENNSLHRQKTNNDSPETALPRQKTNKYTPLVATPNAIDNTAVSDTWLGALFLNSLPGLLFYIPTFIMPLITIFAALGAIYAPLLLTTAAQLPLIAAFPSLATALIAMGSQQPWVTLVTVLISFSTAWYAFLLIPALDYFMGNELRNATPEEIQKASDSGRDRWRYRVLLYAYAAVHITALTLVCHVMCTHAAAVGGVATAAFLGAAVSSGIANGLLYTISHELLHGCRYERIAATALLAPVAYMHWTKSHIAHHIKVGTPEDPSTARKGETLWAFIPRSIWGNLRDGWAAEATRRRAKGISSWDVLRNRVFLWVGAPVALAAMATLVYGQHGLAFFLLQAGVGIFMLEGVNYIEHYGLERRKLPSGRYERVQPRHSWNATTVYTNSVSFRLQRHSDHHANSHQPYHLLQDIKRAPQLPSGYPTMLLTAMVPPLFFRKMDPLVEQAAAAAADAME